MQIINEEQLDFSDVLIKPKRSELVSRKDVKLERIFRGRWNPDISFSCIPIMLANMDNITTRKMSAELLKNNCMVAMNKFATKKEWEDMLTSQLFIDSAKKHTLAYTIGIRKEEELNQFREITKQFSGFLYHLIIDVPNGYTEKFGEFVNKVRTEFPNIFITAGNVVSAEMVQELILRGADCIKVGIGSSPICITRVKSGVGRPQLSTIIECADAAHGNNGYICADGGCSCAGDVAKALGSGSDFVMLGSMFAGHDECAGDIIEKRDYKTNVLKKYKEFWGMSSRRAMEKHYGKMESYRSSEGREVLVPYKGKVQNTIQDILGGLRSAGTYMGARSIKDFPKCCTFYKVRRQVSNMFNDGLH